MTDDMRRAEFLCIIPGLQSAIRTGGDGGRVTLEVPEIYMGEFAKLIAMRGKVLRVTVTEQTEEKQTPKRVVKHG